MAKAIPLCLTTAVLTVLVFFASTSIAASPNTQVPPLQWLEITDLLSGPAPIGLKDASIGYDDSSRTLVIFGGESNGVPQGKTHLLNLDTLQWTTPSPASSIPFTEPPARVAAINGNDFSVNYRHGHVVVGGIGLNNNGLSDAWEYDYVNQFWRQIEISPGGPTPRWGAAGGVDSTALPIVDGSLPIAGPNNTFYLAGGSNGTLDGTDSGHLLSLNDAWEFTIAGTLSPNVLKGVSGSWRQISFSSNNLPSIDGLGSAVLPGAIITTYGGCTSPTGNDNCAQQIGSILNTNNSFVVTPSICPAPRLGPSVVANRNLASSAFNTQAFVLLGTFNSSLWDDGGNLNKGEVDILDTTNGAWLRVLPAGDPSSGTPKFPTPREGAAAFSSSSPLVGGTNLPAADTIVIGGRDENGSYLQEVWILRSYSGVVTKDGDHWSGFGDGQLQSGINASGSGVEVQFLTSCATALTSSIPTSTSSSSSTRPPSPTYTPTSPPTSPSQSSTVFSFDTSTQHKLLSPLSVVLMMISILVFRLSLPTAGGRPIPLMWLAAIFILGAYGTGIGGLASSFTSLQTSSKLNTSTLSKRALSSANVLQTTHGKAGLAFFVALYSAVPVVAFLYAKAGNLSPCLKVWGTRERLRKESNDTTVNLGLTTEKANVGSPKRVATPSASSMIIGGSAPVSPTEKRKRTMSWSGSRLWSGAARLRRSSDSGIESESSTGAPAAFEVVNRPKRLRRTSAYALGEREGDLFRTHGVPRSLTDLSWLERRRSLNAVGEIDYALSQLQHERPDMDGRAASDMPLMPIPPSDTIIPELPGVVQCILSILIHALILGICIISLFALWVRAPKATFVVFLIWTIAFYVILCALAWNGRPRHSILSVLANSIKAAASRSGVQELPQSPTPGPPSRPLSTYMQEQDIYPPEPRGPYRYHQPTYRRVASSGHEDEVGSSNTHGFPPLSGENDYDDEDEETQQRRIEQEMDRREVSIITIPKRKLWVANPS